jgi:sugar lactone lactonase YvrE
VWSLVVDASDTMWAGTGNDGKIWRIDRGGKASVAFDAPELEIHALASGPDGSIYAASSPDGKIYKIDKAGKASTFFDPDDKYIWALAVGANGVVYAGTGEKGRIYRIAPDGTGAPFYDAETTHVISLGIDPKGRLLAGTSSPGRVLRIDSDKKAFVLLESTYKEVRGLRASKDGAIYVTGSGGSGPPVEPTPPKLTTDTAPPPPTPSVSTEITITAIGDSTVVTPSGASSPGESRPSGPPKGAVYRIAPDGEWTTVWESPDDMPYDLVVESSGTLLVATGSKGKIYRLSGNPTLTTLVTRAEAQQVTAFAYDRTGRLVMATSNPGRLLRLSATSATSGTYTSDVRDTATISTWGAIRWRATTPAGTKVELLTRSGNTKTPDKTWSPWSRVYTAAAGELIESPKARYLQWKAVLTGASAGTPILTSVTAAYLPRNTRPFVESITVHPPGVVFQRPFPTGEPELAGFDAGTSDGRPATQPVSGNPSPSPTMGRRSFQKSLQTFVWRASDEDHDRLQYDVLYRQNGETNWKVLKRALWDEIFTWDTTSVPDGTYVLKIVASDAAANAPATTLTGERESTTFDIDNTPPVIEVPRPGTNSGKVVAFTVRDSHSPIQRAEYSQNAGTWKLAHPVDGLLDSREERFELAPDDASNVVLRVTDTLGNVATAVVVR